MELTIGRGPFPTVMTRVEVPSDMKEKREMDVRGEDPWKIFLITHFKHQRSAFLDIKIRLFQDRKEQLYLLFRSYLPMHRFYCRFKSVPRRTTFLSLG